jgi:hypothetical protein
MYTSIILVGLMFFCGNMPDQGFGTIVLRDPRIGEDYRTFSKKISLTPITNDSVWQQFRPFCAHALIQLDGQRVLGTYVIDQAVICLAENGKVSALVVYVKGNGDSIYASMKEKYGTYYFRSYVNTDEAFGVRGKPINHYWKVGDHALSFTLNTFSERHIIAYTNANVDDYMRISPPSKRGN